MASIDHPLTIMISRMKRLPRRHRIAHLRALIRQEPAHSIRREELAGLLRNEPEGGLTTFNFMIAEAIRDGAGKTQ